MDNEVIIKIGDKELHFKLKSQIIVTLERVFGKNIFEIFQGLSFTSMQRIFWECLVDKSMFTDSNDLMDTLLEKYSLIELSNDVLQQIAVKSGILKQSESDADNLEEIKN